MTVLAPAPADPVETPPARRPGSVRRTSTMLMYWPGGFGSELHLKGRARDLLTPDQGDPAVLAASDLLAVTGRQRDVQRIESDPAYEPLQRLVGCRAGGNLRSAIAQELPDLVEAGTPLHLLLDDIAGATLISGFTYFRWADAVPGMRERMGQGPKSDMRGICSGFRDGSSALFPDGSLRGVSSNTPVSPSLHDPADPDGWHRRDEAPEINMCRARRIDVWESGDHLEFDAMFRDTCSVPEGPDVVLHEYQIIGTADRATGVLERVDAVPRVLPYPECPLAADNSSRMVGTELRAMRTEVLGQLRSIDCCTHLNDGLRSLAEVPVLAGSLGG
ncbi:MAG TPA: DUF2889 domain-containing protein [Acidimicrobiales bacterium]|nr:DUF2889 domain-containing protein [Acidimicrobiales bacterium]